MYLSFKHFSEGGDGGVGVGNPLIGFFDRKYTLVDFLFVLSTGLTPVKDLGSKWFDSQQTCVSLLPNPTSCPKKRG